MMGRIFEDDNTTMAITDRGRLLMYPESKQPGPFESGVSLSREDELQEIICKNCFKTRGGKIVDRMGNILLENGEKIHRFQYVPELYQVDEQGRVRALFSHQNYYLANMFAGMEGSALLEEVNRRRENGNQTPVYISGWKVPLDRIAIFDLAIGTTAIGFTWQGSITFVSDEIRHKFLLKYPAFSDNGDGTVGSDILDMCVFCGYIITLHLGGSVHVWRLDEHKPIFEQGITAIGGSNGWFFALDENGMLHKFDMMFNIEKPQVKERFEDCVAFAFNPTRVPMVKSDGHVDFPHRGLFDGYRMLDVWNWRLKDS